MTSIDLSPAAVFLAQAALALWSVLMLVTALSWAAVRWAERRRPQLSGHPVASGFPTSVAAGFAEPAPVEPSPLADPFSLRHPAPSGVATGSDSLPLQA